MNKTAENKSRDKEDVGRLGAKLEDQKAANDHVDFVFIIEIVRYREKILKGGQLGAHHFTLPPVARILKRHDSRMWQWSGQT